MINLISSPFRVSHVPTQLLLTVFFFFLSFFLFPQNPKNSTRLTYYLTCRRTRRFRFTAWPINKRGLRMCDRGDGVVNWGWTEGGDGPTSGWSEASSYCIFVIPRSAKSVFLLVFLTPVNYLRYIHSSFTSLYPSTGGTFGLGIVSSYMGNIYMWISKHLKNKNKNPLTWRKINHPDPLQGLYNSTQAASSVD